MCLLSLGVLVNHEVKGLGHSSDSELEMVLGLNSDGLVPVDEQTSKEEEHAARSVAPSRKAAQAH